MASRQHFTLLWPCDGGRKRTTVKGKPGFTFAGDTATMASNLSSVFASVPGSDGTAVEKINETLKHDGVTDASGTKPLKGDAIVCTFRDENDDTHTYRFPRPITAELVNNGAGNMVLSGSAGNTLATHLSSLTGYTMTFVSSWLDAAKQ